MTTKTAATRKQIAWGTFLFVSLMIGTAWGQSLNDQLFTAAQAGNTATIEALIAKGADVNAQNNYGETPLFNAKNKEIAELLIAKGADVNSRTIIGWTPLFNAKNKEIAELLIAKGADVNAKEKDGTTPLSNAASSDSKEVAELLIAKGADVKGKPLYMAALGGHKDVAELLIAKGADVNGNDNNGLTPLYGAAISGAPAGGHKDIAELLIAKGADVNKQARLWNGATEAPLFAAIESGRIDVAELLIANGANVNAKNSDGMPPLCKAIYNKYKDAAELLIAKGADVNAKEKDGTTPLSNAASSDSKEVAELLIAKGADVNAKNNAGWTPLHYAASGDSKDVTKLLIANGADVNAESNGGGTPLMVAANRPATQGNRDVAELLIARITDVNAKDKNGYTLLYTLTHNGNGNKNIAELLIAKGADVNARTHYYNETLLFGVANKDMAEVLIAHGAYVNAKDDNGETPLHLEHNKDVAEVLIAHGADVFAKDTYGKTPLQRTDNPSVLALIQARIIKQSDPLQALNSLLVQFKGQASNENLRRSIIDLALKLEPNPAIPPEAEAAAGRGTYIFKNANSVDDKLISAKEFLTAIELAPWVANYYYNLCTVLEKTPYLPQALHACKLYLVAAPNAIDVGDMRQHIAGLQYAVDKDKAQMTKRTAYVGHVGREELYRFGGISGEVSGKDVVLKLFVDWDSAPPKYQIFAGCYGKDHTLGETHDLVSTDEWLGFCDPVVSMHLVIKPEGEGFVEVNTASGGNVRATIEELFKAKQETMAQVTLLSSFVGDQERFYIPYVQGGTHDIGWLMFESDCNGSILKKDPRALPDRFVPAATGLKEGGFFPNLDLYGKTSTDICTSRFSSKTGYHFGEME